MRIGTGEEHGLAISYDVSAKGLLLASPATLEVGDAIDVTFAVPGSEDEERSIKGTVVRVSKNEADPDGMWPNRLAVEFEEPIEDLGDVLKATSTRQSGD